jgi:hemolysin III
VETFPVTNKKLVTNTWSREATAYTAAERQVDGVVQICANMLAVAGAIWLILNASSGTRLSLAIYGFGLVAVFASSLAYTFALPGSRKELLRRLDHAMIFVMIAGTYTPLAAHRLPYPWDIIMLMAVWIGAALGIILKCAFPRRFEYTGLALCVALGLSGLVTIGQLHASVSATDFGLLVAGMCAYIAGVGVLLLPQLRFHNAAWHALVLVAAILQFAAIARELVIG